MAANERITPAQVVAEAITSGPVSVTTTGDSMLPHLDSGRLARVERLRLRFGDLGAVITDGEVIVIHRHVITMRGRSLLLGDNNGRFDRPVDIERVLGRVTAIDDEPNPGRQRTFLVGKILRVLARELRYRTRLNRG